MGKACTKSQFLDKLAITYEDSNLGEVIETPIRLIESSHNIAESASRSRRRLDLNLIPIGNLIDSQSGKEVFSIARRYC